MSERSDDVSRLKNLLTAPLMRRYDMQGEIIGLNMDYCEDIRDGHHVYYLPLRVTWHSRSSACADTKTPYAYDVGSGQDYLSHALIACWLRRSRAVYSYTSDTYAFILPGTYSQVLCVLVIPETFLRLMLCCSTSPCARSGIYTEVRDLGSKMMCIPRSWQTRRGDSQRMHFSVSGTRIARDRCR